MNKKIFVDSDIILDLLAKRPSFYDDAAKIFTWAYKKEIELYSTAVVLANVFYSRVWFNTPELAPAQMS